MLNHFQYVSLHIVNVPFVWGMFKPYNCCSSSSQMHKGDVHAQEVAL